MGTCQFLPCNGWRNANCRKIGKVLGMDEYGCVCPAGHCSVCGRCEPVNGSTGGNASEKAEYLPEAIAQTREQELPFGDLLVAAVCAVCVGTYIAFIRRQRM